MNYLGYDITFLLAGVGVFGLVIAFAAQDEPPGIKRPAQGRFDLGADRGIVGEEIEDRQGRGSRAGTVRGGVRHGLRNPLGQR